jgi:ABC-type glutathione transport system ATPase component
MSGVTVAASVDPATGVTRSAALCLPQGPRTLSYGVTLLRNGHAIEVEGLQKRFGEVVALSGIDFTVPPGTVFGLLEPNGAGKTTAVRVLATILQPDGGRAEVLVSGSIPSPPNKRRTSMSTCAPRSEVMRSLSPSR